MNAKKITMEPVSLRRQRIIKPRLCELELSEKAFIFRLKFKAEEPQEDEALPWIEVDNDFVFIYLRKKFAGIEKLWHQLDKRWKIVISINGIHPDLTLFFKRQTDCEVVFDQLIEYFVNQ